MEEIVKRNFTTLSEGLKQQRTVSSDHESKLRCLESKVSQLTEQAIELQRQVAEIRIKLMGTGPTSRG